MKNLVLSMLLCVGSSATALQAQDIAGTWQGTLQPPNAPGALRIVMKITKEADQLKGVLYSIDQGAQPTNAGAITFQGAVLKVAIPAIGGNYEGRMSADGNSIAGSLTQGGTLPMTFNRATPQTAWAIPEPPPQPKPMADDASLVFEIATIKPANPENRGSSMLVGRGGSNLFTTTNSTLSSLITMAYGIHASQIAEGPSWLESERFDITAKPEDPGIPNVTQLTTMVQKLLVERFGLVFHKEKRELTAYVMTVGKNGPKLTKNESGGNLPGFGGRGPGAFGVRNSTMSEFAGFLQGGVLDRPVVDQTGLSGKFDFTMEFRPNAAQLPLPPAGGPSQLPPEIEARPDFFTAIQEQIGLKVESAKTPVEVYVIDKVQKPSEN
jgi:uncharacterized protein (TIGR03435 family)